MRVHDLSADREALAGAAVVGKLRHLPLAVARCVRLHQGEDTGGLRARQRLAQVGDLVPGELAPVRVRKVAVGHVNQPIEGISDGRHALERPRQLLDRRSGIDLHVIAKPIEHEHVLCAVSTDTADQRLHPDRRLRSAVRLHRSTIQP
jgi:hypothetical protein